MKIISICKKCKGKGTINTYGIFKKTCPLCNGIGKTMIKVTDIKNKDQRSNTSKKSLLQ